MSMVSLLGARSIGANLVLVCFVLLLSYKTPNQLIKPCKFEMHESVMYSILNFPFRLNLYVLGRKHDKHLLD